MMTIKTFLKPLAACALVFFGSAVALPFEDSFEAKASTCWQDVKSVDALNDTQAAVLVKPNSLVCLDRGVAKFDCDLDSLGVCKREGPTPPPVPVCPDPTPGLLGSQVSYETMFYGSSYPTSPTYLSPVGAYTLRSSSVATRGPSMVNRYLTTTFVAGANQNVTLRLYGAQPIPEAGRGTQFRNGYNPARPASSYLLVVSPCKGDLRPQDRASSDPWLSKCRVRMSEGAFGWSTVKPAPAAACPLEAGQTYYLTFLFSEDGVSTCKNAADNGRCEVNVRVK